MLIADERLTLSDQLSTVEMEFIKRLKELPSANGARMRLEGLVSSVVEQSVEALDAFVS